MDDNSIMRFGKYSGWRLIDIPDIYLLWCYENGICSGEFKSYLERNIEAIRKNVARIKMAKKFASR